MAFFYLFTCWTTPNPLPFLQLMILLWHLVLAMIEDLLPLIDEITKGIHLWDAFGWSVISLANAS